MQKLVREYLNEWNRKQKKRRKAGIAAALLVVLVVGAVFGTLTQYGIAMTGNGDCRLEEHTHTDDCYTDALVCGMAVGEGAHTHNEDCYMTERTLVCIQEESEEHTHTDGCYEDRETQICELEESDGHTHTDACYEKQLTCGKEEHTHTDSCYTAEEETEDAPDTTADVESQEDWDTMYADTEWKNSWGEDLTAAAKVQISYQESAKNYTVAEDGSQKGYTRFGEFAGDVYTDWNAAFVNFCLHYAGLTNLDPKVFPDDPGETDTAKWLEEFGKIREENNAYLTTPDEYEPKIGDIVFFQRDGEETADQMGIVSSYNNDTDEINVIEGNIENQVAENRYEATDSRIVSYLKITEMEDAYKGTEDVEETEGSQDESNIRMASNEDGISPAAEDNGDGSTTPAAKAHGEPATIIIPQPESTEDGRIELKLYYGRDEAGGTTHYPDGKYTNRAHEGAANKGLPGYFTIMPYNLDGNKPLGDLTLTIHIPKEFINKSKVTFPKLSDLTGAKDCGVTEDETYYHLRLEFENFEPSSLMGTTFSMYYVGGLMPEGYELQVYATLELTEPNGDSHSADTGKNIYCPTYQPPELVKYANTNKRNTVAMAQDGVMIAATVNDKGIVEDTDYASFWYNIKTEPWYMREYEKIILTDTLPTYPKICRDEKGDPIVGEDGKIQTVEAVAYFDKTANPDWHVIEWADGAKTVPTKVEYKPITTDWSCQNYPEKNHWTADLNLNDQLIEAELKLKFPDCLIDEKTDDEKFFKKELTNNAAITCHRRSPGEGEAKYDCAEDDLKFVLTNQPVGLGLAKYNTADVVLDTKDVREGLYRWGIKVTNDSDPKPFREIVITDTDLDERLKLSKIQVETKDYKHIKKVIAVADDGAEYTYTKEQFIPLAKTPLWGNSKDTSCYELNWATLNSTAKIKEFKIYMNDGKDEQGQADLNADDYQLNTGEGIEIAVYSTFKDPGKSHYNDTDTTKNVYHNGAIVEYWRGNTKVTGWTGNDFMLQKMTEDVRIEKEILYGKDFSLDAEKYCAIRIQGSLLDEKKYEDLMVVDMLPEGLTVQYNPETGKYTRGYGSGGEYVKDTEVIPNYNGLGRTALIFHLNADEVKKALDGRKGTSNNVVYFTFFITAPLANAVEGSYTNYAFLHSKDFEPIVKETTVPHMDDIYGIATGTPGKNQIRYGSDSGIIGDFDKTYAEKWIAADRSEFWHKNNETLSLTVGESFRYRLDIVNGTTQKVNGVKAYDVLPTIGDQNIAASKGRSSEYTVRLKGPLEFEGYTVSYTTSNEVYTHSMAEIMNDEAFSHIWLSADEVTNWNDVTAFKIVGDDTEINAKDRVQFVIPVKVTDSLSEESMNKLEDKESEDQASGTITYLEATNSFGYSVGNFVGSDRNNLESNYVKSRIQFAGFVVKKVDSEDKSKGLNGAKFKLEKLVGGTLDEGTWETVVEDQETKTVGEVDGIVSFKNLVVGTYRLTETKSPNGYSLIQKPITVTITQDPSSKFYTVTMDGIGEDGGAGNSADPFIVVNWKMYELPNSGGTGIYWYMFGGVLLMSAAALMTYRNKRRGVLRS